MTALTACALLAGCAEGRDLPQAQARRWLPGAYPHLARAIRLLRTCQPTRPGGYDTIWVSGANDDEPPRCSFGPAADLDALRSAMRQAGVLGVAYTSSGSRANRVESATFILYRVGPATSGASTAIVYHADPVPCVATREGDERFRVVTAPITAAPCRWVWERDEN